MKKYFFLDESTLKVDELVTYVSLGHAHANFLNYFYEC